jgi:hypothetical protein
MNTPPEIALLPATEGHVERAKEAVRALPAKQGYLEALLASNPTRGQLVEFTASVRAEAAAELVKQRITTICQAAGIAEPTAADRLQAMQVGLLQEQNAILQQGLTRTLNQMRSDSKARAENSNDLFTAALGGMLVAATLSR